MVEKTTGGGAKKSGIGGALTTMTRMFGKLTIAVHADWGVTKNQALAPEDGGGKAEVAFTKNGPHIRHSRRGYRCSSEN